MLVLNLDILVLSEVEGCLLAGNLIEWARLKHFRANLVLLGPGEGVVNHDILLLSKNRTLVDPRRDQLLSGGQPFDAWTVHGAAIAVLVIEHDSVLTGLELDSVADLDRGDTAEGHYRISGRSCLEGGYETLRRWKRIVRGLK